MICIVDGRMENQNDICYIGLSLWGNPVIFYPIQSALETNLFERIIVLVDDNYIAYLVEGLFHEKIEISYSINKDMFSQDFCILNGRAPLIASETIQKACLVWKNNSNIALISTSIKKDFYFANSILCKNFFGSITSYGINGIFVFMSSNSIKIYRNIKCKHFLLGDNESIVVNTKNNFELALVLLRKKNRLTWLKKKILACIEKKHDSITKAIEDSLSICLIGHSQLDQWKIDRLGKYTVRNCGISGITSAEFISYILKKDFNFDANAFLIMLGTNDLLTRSSYLEIGANILKIVLNIREHNNYADIYFIECLKVNGRLERDNISIDHLNHIIKGKIGHLVNWIKVESLNDRYGNLNYYYTTDGLHLNQKGYEKLQKLVETELYKEN